MCRRRRLVFLGRLEAARLRLGAMLDRITSDRPRYP